jgi:hypothetical protein
MLAFEREKWEAEQRRLEREFALREREVSFKEAEARRSRWWNPLAIAIMGASIAAAGSAFVSWQNSKAGLEVETLKAESARIFEVVKTGDPDSAAKNLEFLLSTGLIQNSATAANISAYLSKRKEGEGIALPTILRAIEYKASCDAEIARLKIEVATQLPPSQRNTFLSEINALEGRCDVVKLMELDARIKATYKTTPPLPKP